MPLNSGLSANKPVSGVFVGDPYFATDTQESFIWDGTVWKKVGDGVGGGALPTPVCITLHAVSTTSTWTNMPAAETEFSGGTANRTKADLTSAANSRVTVTVVAAPFADAKIKVQYSTDEITWVDLCSVTMPGANNKLSVGVWTAVPAGAKADVFIRIAGIDGNGVADPSFGVIMCQVK